MQIWGILTQKRRKPRNHPDCAASYDLEQKKQNRQNYIEHWLFHTERASQANREPQSEPISTPTTLFRKILSFKAQRPWAVAGTRYQGTHSRSSHFCSSISLQANTVAVPGIVPLEFIKMHQISV